MDQATAVFRAPRPEDGDSRLRAAVAAWVDQEDAPEGDGAAPTKAAEPGNASGAKPASDGPDAGAVEAESASAGADLKPTGSDSATSSVAANSPSAHANSGRPSAKATTADAGSDAVEKRTATPSKSAGDAPPADAKPTRADANATAAGAGKSTPADAEPTSAGAVEPTRADAKPSSAGAGESIRADAEPTSAGTSQPTRADAKLSSADAGKSTQAGVERTSAAAVEPTRADAKLSSADAGEANPAGVERTSAGAGEPTRADANVTAADAQPSLADAGKANPAGAKPIPEAAAQPAPADAKPASAADAKPTPADANPTPADQGASSPSGTPDRGRGVDQPTAVFKAVKPPTADETRSAKAPAEGPSAVTPPPPAAKAPAEGPSAVTPPPPAAKAPAAKAPAPVDQPTAMLKLPAPQRESAGERASQFVPLRSDDAGGRGAARPDASVRRPEGPKVTPPPAAPVGGPTPPVPDRAERTRQQPLPPKPPLDLLAELTNTPPPAQTAVRSTVRRFKIWTPLVLLLVVVFAVVQLMRPLPDPKLALTSSATYTFDGSGLDLPWPAEGQSAVSVDGVGSLGTHGEQKPAPLASVAKTMTAYVILKGHPITGKQEGEKITVDQQAEDDAKKPDESTAPIRKDQQFTEKQMLELLMIPSGNNAARLLARWDAGSEDAFIAKMNDAAKSLGMTSTTYTDPSGLKETTVSTPTDQLKLAQAVMQNDVFRGIVNTPQIKIPGIDTMIYNNNTILLKPGVSGIKTGSSTPAGGNLLWAADTVVDGKNQRIYGIVMGQRTGTTLDNKLKSAINNSYTLIQAVQKAVTSATVVKKGDVVGYVDDGLGGRTPVVAAKDLKAVGWPGLKVDVTLGAGAKPVPHSAKAGEVVGELSIGSGNGRLTAPVELKKALAEPGTGDKLTRLG
ncbi:serine hydrolase [Streptomyces hundungensis]|uniref:serine hydrolase n=1 Tax=Streptomyces hundungensis TaxID=1077946 RepID=UPI0033FC1EFA